MDPITFLQVTHVEQGIARDAAASHNRAVRERRQRPGGRLRSLVARRSGRPAVATPVCVTC